MAGRRLFWRIAWLTREFAGVSEMQKAQNNVIVDLIAENRRLSDRIAALEAAGRLSRRDDDQPELPTPRVH
jgi:hypothetical protein